jgi:hypothetical protein
VWYFSLSEQTSPLKSLKGEEMTRKDYKLIAEVIAVSWFGSAELKADLVNNLADKLAEDNPRFDATRFLTACGVK